MVTVNTGQRTSYADSASKRDNIDERLDILTPTDTPFLSYLGWMKDAGGATSGVNTLKFECTQPIHQWFNDDLIPGIATLDSAYTAASGSLVVGSGEGARFDTDDILMVGETYFQVASISTDTLTVTALSEGAGDANQAAGSTVYLLSNARKEGGKASELVSRHTDFGSTQNFTQIFQRKVELTGTEQATERYGVGEDPFEYQMDKRLKELALEMERVAIYNVRNTTYPSTNSGKRRMGGFAYYTRDDANAVVQNAAGETIDETMLGDILQTIWSRGGMPDTLMVPMKQKRAISSFILPAVRVQRTESIYGTIVGEYVSDAGSLNVVVNRHLKDSDALVFTSSMIGIGPLTGNGMNRGFFIEDMPKDGDYLHKLITGEYTMEVRNNTKAHAWIKNLG